MHFYENTRNANDLFIFLIFLSILISDFMLLFLFILILDLIMFILLDRSSSSRLRGELDALWGVVVVVGSRVNRCLSKKLPAICISYL